MRGILQQKARRSARLDVESLPAPLIISNVKNVAFLCFPHKRLKILMFLFKKKRFVGAYPHNCG